MLFNPVIPPVLPLQTTPITSSSSAVDIDFALLDMDGDQVSSEDSDQEDEEKLPPSDPPQDDGDGNGGIGPPGDHLREDRRTLVDRVGQPPRDRHGI